MARPVKCKYCQTTRSKDEMELILHRSSGGKEYKHYYCKEKKCYKRKLCKDDFVKIFYEYTNSQVMPKDVYKVFNKMMSNGLNEFKCLYVIKFIRDRKKGLNYPWGMMHYVNDAMTEFRKQLRKQREQRVNFDEKNIDKYNIKEYNYNKREDKQDISEFI